MFMDMGNISNARLKEQLYPIVGYGSSPPTATTTGAKADAHRSIETLVVVLAVITIVVVIAGIVARLCGGRHVGGNGEHDIEGWVERKCRNCIDAGIPPPLPPPAAQDSKPAEADQGKK